MRKPIPKGCVRSHAREIREKRGRPMHVAAARAGISPNMLRRLEKGQTDVTVNDLMRLAYSFGVSPVDVMPGLVGAPREEMEFPEVTRATKEKVRKYSASRSKRDL